jgi:hypothetical protein
VLHWQGGDHTQVEFEKIRSGVHRYVTDKDLVEIIRVLARIEPDERIASILNRNQRRTAHGEVWTAKRVYSLRNRHRIPVYREGERQARSEMFVGEAGKVLGVTQTTVLRLIRLKQLPATQACAGAPWVMRKQMLNDVWPNGTVQQPQQRPIQSNWLLRFHKHTKECSMSSSRRKHRTPRGCTPFIRH